MVLSVVVGAVVVLMSACADTSVTSSTGDPTTDAPADATTIAAGASTPGSASTSATNAPGETAPVSSDQIDPGLQPFIDIAVADLAERLSVDPTAIGVSSATLEVWSDASLGCPQPDQQYAQVETDGALIVLTADGKTYRYHAGGSRTPFLCELTPKSTPITGLTTP
jgi:hypothetical protein